MVLKENIWIFKKQLGNFFCDDVIKLGKLTNTEEARIDFNTVPNKKIRDSKVCFLSDYWIKEWLSLIHI